MFLMACALALALDQASKQLVVRHAAVTGARGMAFGGLIRIRHVSNRNGWIGAFRNPTALLIFWALTAVGMALLAVMEPTSGGTVQAALGAAFGGVTGNTIDRLWRGGVVDFLDVRVWPVFNLADVAITAGVLTAIALLI